MGKAQLNRLIKKTFQPKKEWVADLGDGAGTVETGVPNLHYARLNGIYPIKVWNFVTPASNNLTVRVGYDELTRLFQVLSVMVRSGVSIPGGTLLTKHAETHKLNGGDPVYITDAQIMPLLVYATTGMNVIVSPGYFTFNGTVGYVKHTTLDLTTSIPGTGARYSLLVADGEGTISVVDGTPAASLELLTLADAPAVPDDQFPLALVRLYEGQTSLSTAFASPDITPLVWGSQGSGDGGGDGFGLNNFVIVDINGTGDFTSIKAACDYVATQSPGEDNRWAILVLRGVYPEDPITVSTFTSIFTFPYTGDYSIIEPNYDEWTSGPFFTMEHNAYVEGIEINSEPPSVTGNISIFGHAAGADMEFALGPGWADININSNTYRAAIIDIDANTLQTLTVSSKFSGIAGNTGSGGAYFAFIKSTGEGYANFSMEGGEATATSSTIYLADGGYCEFYQYGGSIFTYGDYDIENAGVGVAYYYDGVHKTVFGEISYESGVPMHIRRLLDVNPDVAPEDGESLSWDEENGWWDAAPGGAPGGGDAADITYTPNVLTDWDGDADPGNVDAALDQLAERIDDEEGHTHAAPDASIVTFTPAVAADWDGSADPGDVDNALDQLAERMTDEEGHSHAAPDAANVTFTPAVAADWDGSADPGNTDDALDQLAERTKDLEGASLTYVIRNIVFFVAGELATGEGALELENHFGQELQILGVYLRVKEAPDGSAILVDIHKNGTTIFTNQSHRPQIDDGDTTGDSEIVDDDSWDEGEAIWPVIDAVGSSSPGENLTIVVACTPA